MSTTAEKLTLLLNTKADIKAALVEKGQNVGDVFSTYADKIRAIETSVEPEITVNSAGLVTAAAGDKSVTHQISSSDDADLKADNIVKGVDIFGVTGTAGITATDDGAGNVTITMTGVSGISAG